MALKGYCAIDCTYVCRTSHVLGLMLVISLCFVAAGTAGDSGDASAAVV
jgi:hypothetical protein